MFRDRRVLVLGLSLLGIAILTSPAFGWQSEADLLATLKSDDAPFFDKAIACKELAVIGTEAAVPVLVEALHDPKLSHYARYALEPIPSPKVDEAFIEALSTIKGRHLIGVINSLANRGKPEAIDALAKMLDAEDGTVATAAAHSIARLGTPKAGAVLNEIASPDFAPAGLVAAKTLAQQGHKAEAVALWLKINALRDAPKHVRLSAMLQAIVLQGTDGVEMLAKALASDDKPMLDMALRTARLVNPTDASRAVFDAMKEAPPANAALLVAVLGNLGDSSALPVVVRAAKADEAAVRVAGIKALATLGNADHVDLLLDAALDDSEAIATEAQVTLASLAGDDVDQAVLASLDIPARRALVIQLLGSRRITAAVPKLLTMLDGPDRIAVVGALGETISIDQLDVLGKLLASRSDDVREAAAEALHAACFRMPERDATAVKLAEYLHGASEENVKFLMNELRLIGGGKALATVAEAAGSDNATLKEYATQALGGWLDISVAPVLLDLAKTEGTGKYGVRAMRGYIRLARQFSMPEPQRAAMCQTVLDIAGREAEKKLALEVLVRYPSVDTLRVAVAATKIPSLQDEAKETLAAIVKKVDRESPEVKALLD